MNAPRVLFLNHTGAISGAEMVLLDVVRACESPAAFLFEEGALGGKLRSLGVKVVQSRFGAGFAGIKRDTSLFKALPLAGKMSALVAELALAARRYDVLYANSQKAFVLGSLAASIARRPLIWHLHDIIGKAHFGAGQRRLQVALANRFAGCVVAPSRSVADAFIAEGGRSRLACVVPNGLDMEPAGSPEAEARQELGLPSGPLIGVFSRLAPWKGQHVVLQALAKLPGVHCIVAGSALFGEDAYAASLRLLASDLGIEDRVTFLGQRGDVPALMRAVDIVVHPSVDPEPFGRTLVEAMLARTPVIATDAGRRLRDPGWRRGRDAGASRRCRRADGGDTRDAGGKSGACGADLPGGDPRPRPLRHGTDAPRHRGADRARRRKRAPMRSAAAIAAAPERAVPGWLPAAALIAITALLGPQLGGATRPLFLLGCLATGWYAWSRSPGAHMQAVLALFCFAPFLRRLVDLSAGFDPGGLMIAGPLLALLVPLPEFREFALPEGRRIGGLGPILVFSACVVYAVLDYRRAGRVVPGRQRRA